MSIRAATMSNSYSSTPRRPGFFRKLVVTLLFVVGIASSMALFHTHQKNLSVFWMTVLAILSISVAAGSAARINFYQSSILIRFFVMLLALPLGLFTLGVLTNWQIGIGPLNPWADGNIPQDELIQLTGAFIVALICLAAWRKPSPKIIAEVVEAQPVVRRSREPITPAVVAAPIVAAPVQSRHSSRASKARSQPKTPPRLKFMKAQKVRSKTRPRAEKLILSQTRAPSRSKLRRLFNRKPNLQISLYEEHRCPFCLEEVKANDPRGVKKCEVCNTLHHADCWEITGFCQVPHLNT
jgi:hypothetical protein